jgi:hypothetical protein
MKMYLMISFNPVEVVIKLILMKMMVKLNLEHQEDLNHI